MRNPHQWTYGELMAEFDKKPSGYPIKALSKAVKETQKKKPVTNDDDADSGETPKDGDKEKKVIQKVDPKKYVEINPPLHGDKGDIAEARSQSKIDYLIRLGLGDMDRLSFYRQVLSDPSKANQTPYLRKYVAEVLDLTLDIIFDDPQMYNRVRTKLQDNLPQGGVRGKMKKIEDALVIKSHKSGIDVDVLIEVYGRGIADYLDEGGPNKTVGNFRRKFGSPQSVIDAKQRRQEQPSPHKDIMNKVSRGEITADEGVHQLKQLMQKEDEQPATEHAFNRVNSFIAGGRARKLDADLLNSPGGVGTDEVTKRYADMTPGQSFELIKKALKGKQNG